MNEFDQCPGCRADLLLEDPESGGKGLHCLGCGYKCEATVDDSSVGAAGVSESDKLAYWKRRCEAAERVVEAGNKESDEASYTLLCQTWHDLKDEGEPG